jgi:hypothetical protein
MLLGSKTHFEDMMAHRFHFKFSRRFLLCFVDKGIEIRK